MRHTLRLPALAAFAAVLSFSSCSKENVAPEPTLSAQASFDVVVDGQQFNFGGGNNTTGLQGLVTLYVTNRVEAGNGKIITTLKTRTPLIETDFFYYGADGSFNHPVWPYSYDNANFYDPDYARLEMGSSYESEFKVDRKGNATLKLTTTR